MKTPGQIAWEAQFCGIGPRDLTPPGDSKGWQYVPSYVRSNWEEVGKAVRASVIEECAKVCEALREPNDNQDDTDTLDYCIETIRSLK